MTLSFPSLSARFATGLLELGAAFLPFFFFFFLLPSFFLVEEDEDDFGNFFSPPFPHLSPIAKIIECLGETPSFLSPISLVTLI